MTEDFDPEWYIREMAACRVSVLACIVNGEVEGVLEMYDRPRPAMLQREHAARARYRADPDAARKVGEFCLKVGRTYGG